MYGLASGRGCGWIDEVTRFLYRGLIGFADFSFSPSGISSIFARRRFPARIHLVDFIIVNYIVGYISTMYLDTSSKKI